MFSWFSRKPRNCDRAFEDLAQMLWLEERRPTFRRELLNADRLDFSLASLEHVDDYLEAVHRDLPDQEQLGYLALRTGAYVGEVIRRHAGQEYHWYDFKQASKLSEFVKTLGVNLGTAGVLAVDAEHVCFPIAKVMKYLENGAEDSVHFFARIGIEGPPTETEGMQAPS